MWVFFPLKYYSNFLFLPLSCMPHNTSNSSYDLNCKTRTIFFLRCWYLSASHPSWFPVKRKPQHPVGNQSSGTPADKPVNTCLLGQGEMLWSDILIVVLSHPSQTSRFPPQGDQLCQTDLYSGHLLCFCFLWTLSGGY